jgi:hypothetical protein
MEGLRKITINVNIADLQAKKGNWNPAILSRSATQSTKIFNMNITDLVEINASPPPPPGSEELLMSTFSARTSNHAFEGHMFAVGVLLLLLNHVIRTEAT